MMQRAFLQQQQQRHQQQQEMQRVHALQGAVSDKATADSSDTTNGEEEASDATTTATTVTISASQTAQTQSQPTDGVSLYVGKLCKEISDALFHKLLDGCGSVSKW